MKTVTVHASKNYDVLIGSGLLPLCGKYISNVLKGRSAILVSDDNVFPIYGQTVLNSLSEAGINAAVYIFPHGEQSKNLSVYGEILNAMCKAHLSRKDTVIALGGGVTGDLAGFAAATYQRGIGFVQIPTSLLAAVDSSVGGKTGIDLPEGKNQVGAFYQPSLVLCDTDTLNTLPEEEYKNGCAEIIKYAMIGYSELLKEISETPIKERYETVIERCVSMKRDYVEQDEHDLGVRMMLNFGHTVGHAVEALSNYTVAHGKAVAIGMAVISAAACKHNICNDDVFTTLSKLLDQYGLPSKAPYSTDELAKAALSDKKRQGSALTLVVPKNIGTCELTNIESESLADWLSGGSI